MGGSEPTSPLIPWNLSGDGQCLCGIQHRSGAALHKRKSQILLGLEELRMKTPRRIALWMLFSACCPSRLWPLIAGQILLSKQPWQEEESLSEQH